MQLAHSVRKIVFATSVISVLALTGCKTGIDGQTGSSLNPLSVKQIGGSNKAPDEASADAVVSAAKTKQSLDPKSLQESAPLPPAPPTKAPPQEIVSPKPVESERERQFSRKTRQLEPVEPATPIVDIPAAKFNADAERLRALQLALGQYNLKMVRITEGRRAYVDWDQDRLDSYEGRFSDALPALERYRKAAIQFLRTYDRKFTINGSLETYEELAAGPLSVIGSKVELVIRTIEGIKRSREDEHEERGRGYDVLGALERFLV